MRASDVFLDERACVVEDIRDAVEVRRLEFDEHGNMVVFRRFAVEVRQPSSPSTGSASGTGEGETVMAKDKKIVWVEASAELAAGGKGKWSVSSVVLPTRRPATNAEDTPSPAKPSDDKPQSKGIASGSEETAITKEEPKDAAPADVEGAMSEDTKPKDQAAQSDEDAFTEGMIKWLDREDERSQMLDDYVAEHKLARGPAFPDSLELDPESGECIVNGIRESQFGKSKKTDEPRKAEGAEKPTSKPE